MCGQLDETKHKAKDVRCGRTVPFFCPAWHRTMDSMSFAQTGS